MEMDLRTSEAIADLDDQFVLRYNAQIDFSEFDMDSYHDEFYDSLSEVNKERLMDLTKKNVELIYNSIETVQATVDRVSEFRFL